MSHGHEAEGSQQVTAKVQVGQVLHPSLLQPDADWLMGVGMVGDRTLPPSSRTHESRVWQGLYRLDVEVVCKRLFEGASFSSDRLHNRPEAARYLLTLVTACSDRDTLSKFS
jgi:hypothetical protein